jgi:PAS domain-containing protein
MPQQDVELILMRQLAARLALPIFLVGADGRLLYYNEPAEALLGQRFDASREMSKDAWLAAFAPSDDQRRPLAPDEVPLLVALEQRRAVHRALLIRGLDGRWRAIEATCFPLEGLGGRHLGAVAVFWSAQAR